MNQLISTTCYCDDYLSHTDKGLICILPCEHLCHQDCFKSFKNCPYCNREVTGHKTQAELRQLVLVQKDNQYLQAYIDMMSVQPPKRTTRISKTNLIIRSNELISVFGSFPFQLTPWDCQLSAYQAFMAANIFIEVKGEMQDPSAAQVIIGNHSSYLDAAVMYILTGCTFIGSGAEISSGIGKFLAQNVPVLRIQRGKTVNTVQKISEYLEKSQSRVGIFPEGMITHHQTIGQFRTGAFHTGFPVQPMVIKYKPNPCQNEKLSSLAHIFSQDKMIIEVTFLPMQYPPFDTAKIQSVREMMAQEGRFLMSRISNRMVKDKN